MDAKSSLSLSICTAGYGLQVGDAITSILSMWGVQCSGSGCTSPAGEEAGNCLNAAFQKLAASGKVAQFNNRDFRSTALTGSSPYDSPVPVGPDVQSVVAPVSLVRGGIRWVLRPLENLSAVRAFSQSYAHEAIPLAYFVEMLEGSSGDGMKIYLSPSPQIDPSGPVQAIALEYDVILKPVRFSCQFPHVRLPVAHRYVETLLLPLAKWYGLGSRYFQRPEIKQSVEDQAKEVLTLLGEVSPQPKEVKP